MNWGAKITLAFILFCGLIILFVVKAFQQDFDLVSENYYADDQAYQQRIEQIRNANELTEKVIVFQQENGAIVLQFPKEVKNASGEIHFYHAERKIFDKRSPLQLDSQGKQEINNLELLPTSYTVKINWQTNDKYYYHEQKIQLR
jgi:hypothetical protein